MSSSKQTMSVSTSDLPKFEGRGYKAWTEKMDFPMLFLGIKEVLDGSLTAPTAPTTTPPVMPTGTTATALDWTRYQAETVNYNAEQDAYRRSAKDFTDADLKAR